MAVRGRNRQQFEIALVARSLLCRPWMLDNYKGRCGGHRMSSCVRLCSKMPSEEYKWSISDTPLLMTCRGRARVERNGLDGLPATTTARNRTCGRRSGESLPDSSAIKGVAWLSGCRGALLDLVQGSTAIWDVIGWKGARSGLIARWRPAGVVAIASFWESLVQQWSIY